MSEVIWIDPRSHWMASGRLQADGTFTAATVKYTNEVTRARDISFPSKQEFTSWVRQNRHRR